MKLYENIKKLVQYGIDTGLTPECERIYSNQPAFEFNAGELHEDVTATFPPLYWKTCCMIYLMKPARAGSSKMTSLPGICSTRN